ncbi:capsule assembly Wzi family protein [uncultured Dokdonia sp.]|uniref:capsule assembly Wzi family protein n=1 Tax=uncultured Dokdonia sp. TaxID=575653 RepID=UPI00261E9159|nr:capsule assembly Wzi family protein [uncultured Dokdonia sp.]
MKFGKLLFLLVLISSQLEAQENIEINGAINVNTYLSESELPFWFYRNTEGLVKSNSNAALSAFSSFEYKLTPLSTLEGGISLFYRDGSLERLQRGDLFVRFKAKHYQITLGSKSADVVNGLSSTNNNILNSGNTRPFPGLVIESPKFISLLKNMYIDYGLGHYVLNDMRYVKNTRVHYKRINVKYTTELYGVFTAGVQHYAQWGGKSPIDGDLPNSASDFFKIFLAQSGGDNSDEGEQVNALGNHLGSFDFSYQRNFENGTLKMYHLHLFDDGSGTAFKNFPDGVWGINYTFKNKKFFKNLLYEYVDTRSQSGSSGRSGRDNYFSNKGYRSGWTYESDIIGLPFFELNPETGLGITNNRVIAHHFGAGAAIGNFYFQAKLTYLESLGTYAAPFEPKQKSFLGYLSTKYNTDKFGIFNIDLGLDVKNYEKPVFGLSLGYYYTINN